MTKLKGGMLEEKGRKYRVKGNFEHALIRCENMKKNRCDEMKKNTRSTRDKMVEVKMTKDPSIVDADVPETR